MSIDFSQKLRNFTFLSSKIAFLCKVGLQILAVNFRDCSADLKNRLVKRDSW